MHKNILPYGRQIVDGEDIRNVENVLRSDMLTTGPQVEKFENAVCGYTGAKHGVAVSNGTAALHAAMFALGIGEDDEVIVPPMTFAATSNCVLYQKGKPVFADVDAGTLLIDPASVEKKITPRAKAIIAVDYAGQPCDWDALRRIADKHKLGLVADSCHALGAAYKGQKVGTLADISCFSFHPVKHITTGEGGMSLTNDETLAKKMRMFRGHGIESTAAQREVSGQWHYEMTELGYNYRLTDFQCALGFSQLQKLDQWLARRRELADLYASMLADEKYASRMRPLDLLQQVDHAWHLYVIRHKERDKAFKRLRDAGILANVHYVPVHLHPYYRRNLGTGEGMCPVAEEAYKEILTLPLWPGMKNEDVERVVELL